MRLYLIMGIKTGHFISLEAITIPCGRTEDSPEAGLRVNSLKCEMLENPVGINTPSPRMSWILSDEQAYNCSNTLTENLLAFVLAWFLLIWYIEDLAGIRSRPEHPSLKKIMMRPTFPEGLDHVDASYHSVQGPIESS
ncbi:MAG: alpha-L-rhamnosidase C-terminal domain-containing protein [Bacteroidota bacterium]